MDISSTEIWDAIRRNSYLLYYQPKVDAKTNKIIGFEGLIRLKTATTILAPIDFFDDIVLLNATREMQDFVAETAIKQINQLGGRFSISINIPAHYVASSTYMTFLHDYVKEHLKYPECLEIEIIERGEITELAIADKNLRKIKDLGVKVSMDDFGKGYSSLAYLRSLPIDIVKTDMSFIALLKTDRKQQIIIRAIVNLCHDLGGKVVTEGVEDMEQVEKLREMEVDYFQGYYFSRPLPMEDIKEKYSFV
ncbi:EAL domain-containing protein [Listeria monocytogenes]|uniref:EAL domain-containing protein n=1 Tax=Listeria monocytogenes TaxID=1639 RepID=UPI00086AFA72|nr:EAL domain-containing protein [Listeria monocytogenes]EAD0589951.1 EAL domain-containing protein [Listeria monocytogenes]EAD3115247.1 EAL domain-containing protein [Listeria monocytogenes]EAD3876646.1 EAL domain-containing protein [Listeria monocytogenes]EAD7009439.1 EAL domain-containing protein [Listeria monocytogenes]EAD9169470.1 EAL domain-containing protein [Listeria monocytogenes]